ncbi:MAG: putative glycine dehydrogenase (decarboxylating) subunit 1 [Alphaproteobacteria bacterium MarineAlpha3_Bin7]|nr:MAG: putative glycine dehydrogenase (decarboxylating) subunit 1 [Alphaproteobacteria bacterium MarineAlpha3_Bin7]
MRYLPLTTDDRNKMLSEIGVGDIEELFKDVPNDALLKSAIDLPSHKSEMEVETSITSFAKKNKTTNIFPSFLGAGNYSHHIPASVDHLIQRGEFLTSYTPYQPEIAQGTLQALFEFQTQVSLITGMEVANASMYDGATATSEAVLMACRITRRDKIILSNGLHPHYNEVIETNSRHLKLSIDSTSVYNKKALCELIDENTACIVVQNPDFFGRVQDFTELSETCHQYGALLIIAVTEIISLGALTNPGEMGADIVSGEGQSLGNPISFGGPHVGLLSTREKFLRQMPGRLAGETVDEDGKRGWVLTLSTREQHIRREKATSNICTNSGLCALAFSIHLSLLGEDGFTQLAKINHQKAIDLSKAIESLDEVELINETFFNEFTLKLPKPAISIVEEMANKGVLAGVPVKRLIPHDIDMENMLIVAATELTTNSDIEKFVTCLRETLS